MFSLHIVDRLTGNRLFDVTPFVADAPWSLSVNAIDTTSVKIKTRANPDLQLTRAQWMDLLQPRSRVLVWSYQEPGDPDAFPTAVDGKQIIDWDWDFAGTFTVHLRDIRAELAERYLKRNAAFDPAAVTTLSNQTLYSIARYLVLSGMQVGSPGDGWWTPIIFFTGDETGSRVRTWPHSEWSTLEDLLKATQDWDGGPDVFFEPFWLNTTEFRWNVRIGQPGRLQMGQLEVFPLAEDTPVRGLKLSVSGAKQYTRVWMLGDGRGADRPVGYAGPVAGSVIPESHGVFSSSSSVVAELDQQAAAKRNAHREPTRLFSFDLVAPGTPARVNPGMTIRLNLPGDEATAPGPVDLYVVNLSGDMTDRVKVRVL